MKHKHNVALSTRAISKCVFVFGLELALKRLMNDAGCCTRPRGARLDTSRQNDLRVFVCFVHAGEKPSRGGYSYDSWQQWCHGSATSDWPFSECVCGVCGMDNKDRAIERLIRLRGWEMGYCEFNRWKYTHVPMLQRAPADLRLDHVPVTIINIDLWFDKW